MGELVASFKSSYEITLGPQRTLLCSCPRFRRGLACGHIKALFAKKPTMDFTISDTFHPTYIRIPLYSEWVEQHLNAAVQFASVAHNSGRNLEVVQPMVNANCSDIYLRFMNLEVGMQTSLYFPGLRDDLLMWTEATVDLLNAAGHRLPCESFIHRANDDIVDLKAMNSKEKAFYLWAWLENAMCSRCYQRDYAIKEPF
jgi:hypothetical protein